MGRKGSKLVKLLKRSAFWSATFLAVLAFTALPAWAAITLVIPNKPTATESYATDELGCYLHEITGGQIIVWPDLPNWGELAAWKAGKGRFLIVGNTRFSRDLQQQSLKAGTEAYTLKSDGDFLYLVGATDRGTLYAVYEYLSSLGCRWLTPGRQGEFVPRLRELPPFDFDRVCKPANARRDLCDIADIEPYVFPWLARNRINSAAAQSDLNASWEPIIRHYWEERGGCWLLEHYGHNYQYLVPVDLSPEHPDWFALKDGVRGKETHDGYWNSNFVNQFCTSNPDAIKHVIATVDRFFDANPEYASFGLIPIDGGPWCECPACRALDRPPTGHAGRVIALANQVAEAIHPKHPDKELLVLAYADFLAPPEGLAVHLNVRVQVCLWPNYLQPITGPQTEEGEYYFAQFRKWSERHCRLGVWLYQLYSSRTPFDSSIRAMALNARTYRDMGCDYILHECGGDRAWQNVPLATWCWMQLVWDPDKDWRALIKNFCQAYYGSAGETIAGMFLRVEDRLEKTGALDKQDLYTTQFVAELSRELEMATKAADSDLTRARVLELQKALPDPKTYPASLPPGKWWHIAATWEAGAQGKVNLYVNGKLMGTQTGNWQEWKPTEIFYLCRRQHGGRTFSGQMDEVRISAKVRDIFDLERPPAQDAATTLLAHYDRDGVLDADFAAGGLTKMQRVPPPYTLCRMTSEGRFGAGLDVREVPTFDRFDTVMYRSEGILDPRIGTIELWMRPGKQARYVAEGTFVDAGALTLGAAKNVLSFSVGGLSVTCDLTTAK